LCGFEVDGNGSGSCPTTIFGIRGVEPSESATIVCQSASHSSIHSVSQVSHSVSHSVRQIIPI